MCGRFENIFSLADLIHFLEEDFQHILNTEKPTNIKKRNIAPADQILTIKKQEENYLLDDLKWGIKFSEKYSLIFNSRIETITAKANWKGMFNKNRILIPMTGFYEWPKINGKKIPHKISLPDEKVFFVPGLFTNVKGELQASLVTTEPNEFMRNVHHRMPVIFTKDMIKGYFTNSVEDNINLCAPLDDSKKMDMELADI